MDDAETLEFRREAKRSIGLSLEAALLNVAIFYPDFMDEIVTLPQPDDFEHAGNAQLWKGVLETRREGPFSKTRLLEHMRTAGWGAEHCQELLDRVDDALFDKWEAKRAAEFLMHRTMARRGQMCASDFLKDIEEGHYHKAPEALERLQRQLADVSAGARGAQSWAFGEEVSSERSPCVPTGLRDLDEMMGGLQMGVLGIVGARPSIGKTALACSLALNIAARGEGVGIFSLEMPAYDLQCRMAAAHAYSPVHPSDMSAGNSGNPYYQPFFHRRMTGPHYERMRHALAAVRRAPIGFDDSKGLTAGDIRTRTRRLKSMLEHKGAPLRAIFTDHIGHIKPEINRGGNRTSETTDVSKALMDMAGELGVAVVALSQLSRQVEQRANKRPVLSDLRESGSLEQDAAYVMFLYRDEYYADRAHEDDDAPARKTPVQRNVMEIIIAKQRNGPVGTVEAFCEVGANAILDQQFSYSRRAA